MEFVKFERGKQRKFMQNVKERSGLTWDGLADKLGKTKRMCLFYLFEDSMMPKVLVESLSSQFDVASDFDDIISIHNTSRIVQLPSLSSKFAEFIGALAGDGHLDGNPHAVDITCNRHTDKDYIDYLSSLFESLFLYKPHIYPHRNVLQMRSYCKDLVLKLNKIYAHPIGAKKGRLHIPPQILANQEYLISYLRGLFDTDGSISRHHKKLKSGAIVEIISCDKGHLNEIVVALQSLGFRTSRAYKSVKIYAKEEIHKFFKVIKPANPKHLNKYLTFQKEGYL